jgi:hypothetical protein
MAKAKLSTDCSSIPVSPAGNAFRMALKGHAYGEEALTQAWYWFCKGWKGATQPPPEARPCTQCITMNYWYTPNWPWRLVRWTNEQCPACKLWICDDCFNDDHIFCGNDDVGMTSDLAWLSALRKEAQAANTDGYNAKADAYIASMVEELGRPDWPASRDALEQKTKGDQP